MKFGSRVRALMLVLTFLVLATPFASAQSDLAATPEADAPIETPIVEEAPVVETTPDVTPDVTPEPEVVDPQPDGDGAVTPEAEEGDEPATTPESSTQSRTGDVELMATRFIEIDLQTSDSAPVPDGTEVCFYNSEEGCQDWEGETLTFSPFTRNAEFYVYTPSGSGYAPAQGMFIVPTGPATVQTIVLEREATVAISLEGAGGIDVPVGTEVCLDDPVWECQDWAGIPLTFTVEPGTIEYSVYPGYESGLADAFGTIEAAPGATVVQTVTLEAPGTLNVTVVTADGRPVSPYDVDVTVPQSREYWDYYEEGTPLVFNVTPGDVAWQVYLSPESRYQETAGSISVGSGESVDLVITLQPKAPGSLRVYLSTDLRQSAPTGTVVCIDMPSPESGDPIEGLCQTATGDSVFFPNLDRGDVDVTVTPPLGSGYLGGTWTYQIELGQTTRVWVELVSSEETFTATVEMTIRMSDGSEVTSAGPACLLPGTGDNLYLEALYGGACIEPVDTTVNPDGSITMIFQVPAGTYYYVAASVDGVSWAQGSVTAVSGGVTPIDIVFQVEPSGETAFINASVETLVGEPVPDGTMLCVAGMGDLSGGEGPEVCQLWSGDPILFEVPAGPIVVAALPPEDSDYLIGIGSIFRIVEPGQTYDETVVLYPYQFEPGIEMNVSNEAPQSGDTVTYTIRAYGSTPWSARMAESGEAELTFEITDVLPDELSDVTVTCGGTFFPSVPSGACADLEGQDLSIFGSYWLNGVFDVTITVTGTVTGDPGTVVTNTAYLHTQYYREEVNSTDLDVNMVASTGLSGMLFQITPDVPSASATLVIAGQVPVEPTPDPTETPVPGETPTPDPTEAPVDPTPDPTETPISGETPTPAPGETPVPGETPAVTPAATQGAVTALPSTGAGAETGSSLAIAAGLAAALVALGAGVVVRTYRTRA